MSIALNRTFGFLFSVVRKHNNIKRPSGRCGVESGYQVFRFFRDARMYRPLAFKAASYQM